MSIKNLAPSVDYYVVRIEITDCYGVIANRSIYSIRRREPDVRRCGDPST